MNLTIEEIIEKEISLYKEQLKKNIFQHLNNPYCAKTDMGNLMYEKEIFEVIENTK